MNKDIKNHKYALLNIKPKYNCFIFITIIVLIFILISSIYIKTYDSFKYSGIANNYNITLNVKIDDVKNILDCEFIKIDNKRREFSVLSVSEIQYDEYTLENYQTVILTTSDYFVDNLKMDITFYKNKQRIIVKILNLFK